MKVGRFRDTFFGNRFLRKKPTMIGLGMIIAIVIFVLVGPYFVHYPPLRTSGNIDSPPSFAHPFGTDYEGHDLLSQVIYGAYPTLTVGLASASGAVVLGFTAGLFGGYYGKLQALIYGITDVVLSFPALVLLLLVGSIFIATNAFVSAALIVVLWPTCARAIRAQVSSLKKMAYIDAARKSGLKDRQILWTIIAPEVAPIGIAFFVLYISVAIVVVTALEFLGVGDVAQVSWGSILFFAQNYGFFTGDWWWVLAPGIMIALTSTAFALVGFSVEEIMNPRLRV